MTPFGMFCPFRTVIQIKRTEEYRRKHPVTPDRLYHRLYRISLHPYKISDLETSNMCPIAILIVGVYLIANIICNHPITGRAMLPLTPDNF